MKKRDTLGTDYYETECSRVDSELGYSRTFETNNGEMRQSGINNE